MSDPKPPMPAQPATKKLLAITPEEVAAARAPRVVAVNTETLDAILTAVHDVKSGLADVRADVADFKEEVRDRLKTHSDFRRSTSQVDSTQDAAIAKIVTDLGDVKTGQAEAKVALAENTALTRDLKKAALGFFNHRAVQALIFAAVAFATAWLMRHT